MKKYLNPDETGREKYPKMKKLGRPPVKNTLCPRDGHYCEQPKCENCMMETVGENNDIG